MNNSAKGKTVTHQDPILAKKLKRAGRAAALVWLNKKGDSVMTTVSRQIINTVLLDILSVKASTGERSGTNITVEDRVEYASGYLEEISEVIKVAVTTMRSRP